MKDCKFCEEYTWWKESTSKSNRKHNRDPNSTFRLRTRIETSIVVRTFRYGGDGNYINRAGRIIHGHFPIRFCPVCGRKVK